MGNALKPALGDRNDSEFVIAAEGKILHARSWSDPDQLRKDLAKLVGPIEKPTTITNLKRKKIARMPRSAASGIVTRVARLEDGHALKQSPIIDPDKDMPFYAKLRVEAERQVITEGNGKLHLGFHLDPIYDVHWNNLAAPLEFEPKATNGSITAATIKAPKIEVESDVDPREFLLEAKDLKRGDSFNPTVRCFACNDKEGWCKPVTQSYTIHLEPDRDAGRLAEARGGGRGQRSGGSGRMLAMLK